MPLYEAILLAKAGPAQNSVYLLRSIVNGLLERYPHAKVRDVQNLGDRVMGKPLKKGQVLHYVGRYLQLIYDAAPAAGRDIHLLSQTPPNDTEVFRMYVHRLPDYEYPLHMYLKATRLTDLLATDPEFRDFEYAKKVGEFKNNSSG